MIARFDKWLKFFLTHMWFKYGTWGWRANHQPICGHCTLSFSCGWNTTKPEAEKERGREGELVALEGLGPISHCATTIRPVTDPWTRSLQVNCDRLLCVYVCVFASCGFLCVCICILSLDAGGCRSLSPAAECRNMHVGGAHVVIRC